MTYSIFEIANILKIKEVAYPSYQINHLLTDSREVFKPELTLFFAIKTCNDDGHTYIADLYNIGVRNFIIQQTTEEIQKFSDANFLVVKNTLDALQRIAAYHRKRFDIPIIGITGSNGKTVTKEWLTQIIEPIKKVTRSPRSYNSQIGVPLSVWQLDSDSQIGIFEAGISMPNEMTKLQKIISPTIGIFTNIGDAHQENFSSMKQKCLEKLELFIKCDVIICEEDNALLEECMEVACLTPKRFTWSRNKRIGSHLVLENIERLNTQSIITYSILDYRFSVKLPFTDDASIENVTHAIAVALYLNIPIETIQEQVSILESVAMRLDVRKGKNNNIIINDTYNADINSLKIAISFLSQQSIGLNDKKTLILSDILQSGFSDEALYKSVSELLESQKIQKIIGIGKHITSQKGAFENISNEFFETTQDFIDSGVWNQIQDETILIKGSRTFQFERISDLIEQKTHETVLDVNLDAIIHNYKLYRSKLQARTKIICMIKADGYGSGSIEVAKALQYHKCDYFAVAVAEEGVELRKAGIKIPIIVLNPEVAGFRELFTYNLEPEIYNFRILETYIRESQRKSTSDYPIHIKIDTGMNRLGFKEGDIAELAHILKNQKGLRVQSVFSHLAASESWVFDDFTIEQISKFKRVANSLEVNLNYSVWKHILNSAGIERFPAEQMDMVRLGISMYGISASGLKGVQNVFTMKATILHIIDGVSAGETVGYGRKGVLLRDSKVATIRIGYADGLNRQLGNGVGKVFIKGQYAPFIGNICMDLSMIDVTDIDVKEGDQVVIFGSELPITDIAKKINTIPYEILTSVSNRVKRIYYRE